MIEGIMMRGPKMSAMAVRNPEGEIILEKWETKTKKIAKVWKLPLIRGVFNFIESMRMGYKCLMRSAEIAGLEEETPAKKENEPVAAERDEAVESLSSEAEVCDTEKAENGEEASSEQESEPKKTSVLMTVIMIVASVLGVVLALVLFLLLPTLLFNWIARLLPFLKPENRALTSLYKAIFEGVIRIAIMVVYMLLVSRMKDIRRTFQYHGAEHKTIFCYEHGLDLTVENIRNERRFHPRCGTSFLILMLIVSIFISFWIDPLSILIVGHVPSTLVRVLIKLLLLPLVMGIGYELIKMAGRHDNLFTRIISAPGMWLQRITVLEPEDDMIECAILAFKEVIPQDDSDRF